MPAPDQEIILHNYPQSPVAEKVKVALGIKGLSWRDVEIPRLPPKPMLTTLTGGYRRTPVMQIGADIYCDSQCIIDELERRHLTPSFFPTRETGLVRLLSRWTDGAFFDLAVKLVLGAAGSDLPRDFAADRGRLYLGADWTEGLKKANAQLPHLVAQMRAHLTWLEDLLGDDRSYLLGSSPAAIDAQIYHVIWFIEGRWSGGPTMLSEFSKLVGWKESIAALGHGKTSPMAPEEAITRAKELEPVADAGVASGEPQDLQPGIPVSVSPDLDGGEQPVEGKIRSADSHRVVLERDSEEGGRVCVHFPRSGYRIEIL